jgi:hypothetical protein
MGDALDERILVKLQRDEAIVMYWYLTRELLRDGAKRLKPTFASPAEELALEGLMHELSPTLSGPATPEYDVEHEAALEHLSARFR